MLDPACGSGNFLYLALKTLKDIEHSVHVDIQTMELDRPVDLVTSPANVLGIEINEYAAELARVTIWIGELQWRLQHGYPFKQNPVLEPLDHIECRDALLARVITAGSAPSPLAGEGGGEGLVGEQSQVSSASQIPPHPAAEGDKLVAALPRGERGQNGATQRVEALWPRADAVIGNPPFVGDKKMRAELGDEYTETLRKIYEGRVPGGADLVTYWFAKAGAAIASGRLKFAGLVSTNSIRQRANRSVIEGIIANTPIHAAWSDETWVNDGAAVRVSIVCIGDRGAQPMLDGKPVSEIHADLTASDESGAGNDLTKAKALPENSAASFFGLCLAGPFKVNANTAAHWLRQPNPNGKSNADVVRPIYNGVDVTKRWAGDWTIDFGPRMTEADAALYEAPFSQAERAVKPVRVTNNRAARAKQWWRHGEARPGLRLQLSNLRRFIATVETSKHRLFVTLPTSVAPEHRLIVVPREDDATFGILQSKIHVCWALAKGGTLEDRPVYNTSQCFETFPFPAGLTPRDTAHQRTEALAEGTVIPADLAGDVRTHADAIARAAKRLNDLRERWLNPPEWTEAVPEVIPLGMVVSPYPDRILPRTNLGAAELAELKKRTLTNLYNQRPAWLADAHATLDAAVAAAYGWADYSAAMTDNEILARLLALNLERAAQV